MKEKLENTIQEHRLRCNIEAVIGEKFSQFLEYFILFLILFVLSLLVYDLSVIRSDDHILNPWNIFYIDSACCTIFLLEFFFRLSKADNKWWFIKTYWVDFITSLPIPPMDSRHFGQVQHQDGQRPRQPGQRKRAR